MNDQTPDPIADAALEAGEMDTPLYWETSFAEVDNWLRQQSPASLIALADAAANGLRQADATIPAAVLDRAREVLLAEASAELRRLL